MENNFGRTEENWYLEVLKQNQRIKFDNGVVNGTGVICGIASNPVPVLGYTYIVKPDKKIDDYTHIVMGEIYLTPFDCKHENKSVSFMGGSEYMVQCKDCNEIIDE